MKMKILFFLESLQAGGKERRAVELFHYLKQNTNIEFKIVLTEEEIHYNYILKLNIPIIILKRGFFKKDPTIFIKFFRIVRAFKPDIIHAWGAMSTFYAIPSSRFFHIPLINGQVADSKKIENRSIFFKLIWEINHQFSTLILSNSKSGMKAYRIDPIKGRVIYNGVRLDRFQNLADKETIKKKFNIKTPFVVVMVASFGVHKDYKLFLEVANKVCDLRDDVTFLAVGDGETRENHMKKNESNHIIFTGRIINVEELINISDIGVLLSTKKHGEGVSNSIIEYMVLSKPVVATDAGGTNELLENKKSGYLVKDEAVIIIEHINILLDNQILRIKMGNRGKKIIENRFTIDKMGYEFLNLYNEIT